MRHSSRLACRPTKEGPITTDPWDKYQSPGLAVFGGILAGIVGAFNLIYGVLLLLETELIVVSSEGLIYLDITAWAWLLVLFGVVQIGISIGIMLAKTWARLGGMAWASLIAVGQMAFLGVSPIWSLLIIAFCVLIIYSLAVGLGEQSP